MTRVVNYRYNIHSITCAEYWFYDGRLGRRWNVDPVFKPWRSPYDGFRNCPLVFIDPNGDDDYTVNSKGEIKFVKETKDEKDRLIAVSGKKEKLKYNKKNGELKNISIELDKGILNNKENVSMKTDDGEDIKGIRIKFGVNNELANKTFEFLAQNTYVEWAILEIGDGTVYNSTIYTSHLEDKEYFSSTRLVKLTLTDAVLIIKHIVHIHSHPRLYGESMYGKPSDKDIDFRDKVKKMFPNAQFYIFEKGISYEYTNKN